MNGHALLLVGSPKGPSSNSYSIGRYMLERLCEAGWTTDLDFIYQATRDDSRMRNAVEKMDASDLVILSFPLYVDSLPTQMIKFLEQVDAQGRKLEGMKQRLTAVCQSGFPESHQNDCALGMCRIFALESGFEWAGGLAVGGGSAIGHRRLEDAGDQMRALRMALDLTVKALADERDVPEEAKGIAANGIPPLLYNQFINSMWQKECERNQVVLEARPYA